MSSERSESDSESSKNNSSSENNNTEDSPMERTFTPLPKKGPGRSHIDVNEEITDPARRSRVACKRGKTFFAYAQNLNKMCTLDTLAMIYNPIKGTFKIQGYGGFEGLETFPLASSIDQSTRSGHGMKLKDAFIKYRNLRIEQKERDARLLKGGHDEDEKEKKKKKRKNEDLFLSGSDTSEPEREIRREPKKKNKSSNTHALEKRKNETKEKKKSPSSVNAEKKKKETKEKRKSPSSVNVDKKRKYEETREYFQRGIDMGKIILYP